MSWEKLLSFQDEIYLQILLINFKKVYSWQYSKCFDTHSKNTT